MPNIRDIIEAATPGPWRVDDFGDIIAGSGVIALQPATSCFEEKFVADRDATFIATFDPEHVALMEAVCEAADESTTCAECYDDCELTHICGAQRTTRRALSALTTYRKERGLL